MSIFSKIISPIKTDDFFSNYWTKNHLHIKGKEDKFSNLFSWNSFENILNTQWYNLNFPDVRIVANGRVVPKEEITEYSEYFVGGEIKEHISPKAISDYAKEGATIVLATANKIDINLQKFSNNLSSELGEKLNINVYCSFPEVQSFAGHHDKHEVIILQISGKKEWNIFDFTMKYPIVGQPQSNPNDTPSLQETILLEPGDLLYVPRGLWHNATAKDEPSLHLTLGLPCRTGIDFMSWLITEMIDIESFRKNLPMNFDVNGQSKYQTDNFLKHISIFKEEISLLLSNPKTIQLYNEYLEEIASENSNPIDFPLKFDY